MILRFGSLKGMATLLLALFFVTANAQPERVQEQASEHAIVELWEALLPLGSVNSFMNTGAHPDDERSSLLAYLSRGEGARVVSVTANRGEGGQNAIGTEYDAALGVLRSREMEEASRAFGVDLYFLSEGRDDPIYDFGFSKSPEETLEQWGEDVALQRLVRIIRESRPDVLFTSFLDTYGQHGHHRAIHQATLRAFDLAADPEAFPEQLEAGLSPWQPRKLYIPGESGGGGTYADADAPPPVTLEVDTGTFDPIFGATYEQLGEQSRVYHLSQGMGSWRPEGPDSSGLHLLRSTVNRPANDSAIFAGLPHTVGDLADDVSDSELALQLRTAQGYIEDALSAYPNYVAVASSVQGALAEVRAALARVPQVQMGDAARNDLTFRLTQKERELTNASARAGLLITRLEVTEAEDDEPENTYALTPGASTSLTLTAYRGGEVAISDVRFELVAPQGWTVTPQDTPGGALGRGETLAATYTLTAPEDAPFTDPYLAHASRYGSNSMVYGRVHYRMNGVPVTVQVAPESRLAVLPELSLEAAVPQMILNTANPSEPFEVDVTATSFVAGESQTALSLAVPDGWTVEPAEVPLTFSGALESLGASFTVTPPEGALAPDRYSLSLRAEGQITSEDYVQTISYPHVGDNYLRESASVEIQAFPVTVQDGLRIGYVDGGSDTVYEALRQLGFTVDLLDDADLSTGNLSAYDTIVVGIYAYGARPDLAAANSRLLDYARSGGNLFVQYHRPSDNWDTERTAPFPLELGSPSFSWRVTDETSAVTFLAPESPLLNVPNEITAADWEGWVKDRALYIPMAWDESFTPVISIADPGEEPFEGSLLTTDIDEGRYTYSSLIFYYQVDNLVPGAFRMLANFVTPPE